MTHEGITQNYFCEWATGWSDTVPPQRVPNCNETSEGFCHRSLMGLELLCRKNYKKKTNKLQNVTEISFVDSWHYGNSILPIDNGKSSVKEKSLTHSSKCSSTTGLCSTAGLIRIWIVQCRLDRDCCAVCQNNLTVTNSTVWSQDDLQWE